MRALELKRQPVHPCFSTPSAILDRRIRPSSRLCELPRAISSSTPSASSSSEQSLSQSKLPPTPITPITFRKRRVFIKRDDTLRLQGLSGSKARKLRSLTRPGALDNVSVLASFGGVQSNAMLSLARFAAHHGIPFVYYAPRPVPAHVARQASGNYADAVRAGMRVRQIPRGVYEAAFMHLDDCGARSRRAGDGGDVFAAAREWVEMDLRDAEVGEGRVLFVPQGGAWPGAEDGVAELATEIAGQLQELRSEGVLEYASKSPILFMGAGTGATAFYLARHLRGMCKVVAVPVAGSADYLVEQMLSLNKTLTAGGKSFVEADVREDIVFPDVLRPQVRSTFADVREGKLLMWKELERAAAESCAALNCEEIHFDLIYGPNAWEEVWLALGDELLDADRDLVFLHTGGEEGNLSMLDRFCFRGLLSRDEAKELLKGQTLRPA